MMQATRHVLMIRPRRFGPNADTAATNAFQQAADESPAELNSLAVAEFDSMVARLLAAGVEPHVFEDTDSPAKPDAVFPNNWVSFHDNGDIILYPMHAPNRRPERRRDVIEDLAERGGFRADRIIDLSALERQGEFLEGTGSLVLDRTNGVAYAALSSRTHPRRHRGIQPPDGH